MQNRNEAISYLITKLKWATIESDNAARNGEWGSVNYENGQACAFRMILWDVYGMANDEIDAIVANQIAGRC